MRRSRPRASARRFLRDDRGLTLIEVMLAALFLSILGLGVQSVALAVFKWADVANAELQQNASYGRALQVVSQDLRQPPLGGISIGGATYNTANTMTLTWTDQTTTPLTSYSVSYAISGTDLTRTMTKTQGAIVTSSTITVARSLDAGGASGGAQFSRLPGAPGVVRTLLTLKVGNSSTTYDFTVEQRP